MGRLEICGNGPQQEKHPLKLKEKILIGLIFPKKKTYD